jgi:hypothetical protein
LRHTFNAALANAGVSVEIRQKLTRHTSPEMNAIYTHHDLEIFRARSLPYRELVIAIDCNPDKPVRISGISSLGIFSRRLTAIA